MLTKLKTIAVSLIMALAVGAPLTAGAACEGVSGGVAKGVNQSVEGGPRVNCDTTEAGTTSGITDLARQVVNIFSIIIGAIAIIMLLYGGFRYITSGGSSDKVGNAKNTLLYAIIGLIIVALAQVIVNFVLGSASNVGNDF